MVSLVDYKEFLLAFHLIGIKFKHQQRCKEAWMLPYFTHSENTKKIHFAGIWTWVLLFQKPMLIHLPSHHWQVLWIILHKRWLLHHKYKMSYGFLVLYKFSLILTQKFTILIAIRGKNWNQLEEQSQFKPLRNRKKV